MKTQSRMKDHSMFEGIKELRGPLGNYRIENGHYYKQEDDNGNFVHKGTIGMGYKKLPNHLIDYVLVYCLLKRI